MLITGVSPSNAHNREWRRSEPGASTAPRRKPFRFSAIDVILDLSADAIRQTGQYEAAPARQRPSPPETYTASGTPAYYQAGAPAVAAPFTHDETTESKRHTAPRDGHMLVTFDGMLRSPPPEDVPSSVDL